MHKKHNILGNLFKTRRESLGYNRDEVAYRIKASVRSIRRIENGETLSSATSYIISQLLVLYQFSDDEVEQIRRYICILKTMINIVKKYDGGKCHG